MPLQLVEVPQAFVSGSVSRCLQCVAEVVQRLDSRTLVVNGVPICHDIIWKAEEVVAGFGLVHNFTIPCETNRIGGHGAEWERAEKIMKYATLRCLLTILAFKFDPVSKLLIDVFAIAVAFCFQSSQFPRKNAVTPRTSCQFRHLYCHHDNVVVCHDP